MLVPNGSVVTYKGVWTPTNLHGAESIISSVSSDLTGNGIPVRNASSNAGVLQNSELPFVLDQSPFTVTLTLQVENGLGFGDEADVISIVRHWVFIETGMFPISDTVPQIQVPGNPSSDTGEPNPPVPSSSGGISGILSSTSSTLQFGIAAAMVGALIIGGLALHGSLSR